MKKILLILFAFLYAMCVIGQNKTPATQQTAKSKRPKLAIEYFAEYNLQDDEFGNSHNNDQSSYYTHEEALQVCPKGWHLPKQDEWAGLFSYNRRLSKGEAEPITINGNTKKYFSEYKDNSENRNIQYGIRFKRDPDMEFDNSLLSAFRYEYIGEAPMTSGMKVTVRYLGETFTGKTIDDIANELYWSNNNKDDISRIFPYLGYKYSSGKPSFCGETGLYWTASSFAETSCGYCPRMVRMSGNTGDVTFGCNGANLGEAVSEAKNGYSVRCIRDKE